MPLEGAGGHATEKAETTWRIYRDRTAKFEVTIHLNQELPPRLAASILVHVAKDVCLDPRRLGILFYAPHNFDCDPLLVAPVPALDDAAERTDANILDELVVLANHITALPLEMTD
jgi:hypothetical protein